MDFSDEPTTITVTSSWTLRLLAGAVGAGLGYWKGGQTGAAVGGVIGALIGPQLRRVTVA
jgi:hypothetical protein